MTENVLQRSRSVTKLDYSLTGVSARRAVEMGLAEAEWYQCPVTRTALRELLERKDGPAIQDTLLWFALLFASGLATVELWGRWWAVWPYLCYSVLYASTSDSRWHEAGHGTAFKSDWMNNALYEIASFMVMRESTVWRWSHTRHHSDTIIVGRDPEIAVPRPPSVAKMALSFFNLPNYPKYFKHIVLHSLGRMSADERTFIPASEFDPVYRNARVYVAIYVMVIAASTWLHSVLPLMLVGLTNLFGTWLLVVYGLTQHAGLAENVLDHRLNCRTVMMNPVHRFLYWNMNYHVEHHMFPLVPYHALPKLHEAVKDDCPPVYPSLWAAWREIVPAVARQVRDPAFHIKRRLPEVNRSRVAERRTAAAEVDGKGWVAAGRADQLRRADVMRFDHGRKTFALYRDADGKLFATDGTCTHGNVHLSGGLVKDGTIECPKHNGRFHLADGSPARAPICRGLATYPIREERGSLLINIERAGGAGARSAAALSLRVQSARMIATFIKEIVLEPVAGQEFRFVAGDYVQIEIPSYDAIQFTEFDVPEPYSRVWHRQHVFDLTAHNPEAGRRNHYSIASNQETERTLRLNVRLATPPPGQECGPGAGSSYMFRLKPGDVVNALGPFGDFHIKPTQREMVYIGGGAGMAPLRAHISQLFETNGTARKVSFWYGARSLQEVFYADYFEELERRYSNFRFHVALSDPQPEDGWAGSVGFIHEVILAGHLEGHENPSAAEYYLCGPPMMIKACTRMLEAAGVPATQIAYDEF